MGALHIPAAPSETCGRTDDDGEPCGGTLEHVAADRQFDHYICDACNNITTKPTGATP